MAFNGRKPCNTAVGASGAGSCVNGAIILRKWTLSVAGCNVETVFATVVDIARNPEFLPGIVGARVVVREEARWLVENAFGFGFMQSRFRSFAEPNPPAGLTVRSTDGPWRNLLVRWRVTPQGSGCVLSCDATLDFHSPLLAALAQVAAPSVERRVAEAFEKRLMRFARDAGDDKRVR